MPEFYLSLSVSILAVLVGWAIFKLDRILTMMVTFHTTLYGVEGEGGLVRDVASLRNSRGEHADKLKEHEVKIGELKQNFAPTRYLPKV
jgi:hypothetical protein